VLDHGVLLVAVDHMTRRVPNCTDLRPLGLFDDASRPNGRRVSQQCTVDSLSPDPNRPTPATTSGDLVPSGS